MTSFNLIRKILSPLLFLNIAKQYERRMSLIKIRTAQIYVQGAQKVRILILGIILTLGSFIFMFGGLNLIHTALFTYSNLSMELKFGMALLLGILELSGAVSVLVYLSREETWAKFIEIEKVIDSVMADSKNKKEEAES